MTNIPKLLKLIKDNKARFISLKYVDITGQLQQVDVIAEKLLILDELIIVHNIKLQPIEDKYFFDPFRSSPTIFCLCKNLSNQSNQAEPRLLAEEYILANDYLQNIELELVINFLINDKNAPLNAPLSDTNAEATNYRNQVEPCDKLANLRAEIIDNLERIGIVTIFHCHAREVSSCSVAIKSKNFLDMADNYIIAKFIIMNVAESYGKIAYFSNKLVDNLFILLPSAKYDKDLAILFISSIISRSTEYYDGNILSCDHMIKSSGEVGDSADYYYHDIIRNYHVVKFNLQHQQLFSPYFAISYVMLYNFDGQLSDIFRKGARKIFR
jgi:hypothetical protein